jgi:hypothetical protein
MRQEYYFYFFEGISYETDFIDVASIAEFIFVRKQQQDFFICGKLH